MNEQQLPLGQRETTQLEFKGAGALDDLSKVAREVVAMLNAHGGVVWVGVEEEDGVAMRATGIADAGRHERRLRDYLIDAIEPSPLSNEIRLDALAIRDDRIVFRIEVARTAARKPYALLRGASRRYLIRVGDRNRPMSREEIADAFGAASPGDQDLIDAEKEMLEARRNVLTKGQELFWLRLRPIDRIELDLREPSLESIFRIAKLSGNRPAGWTFVNPYRLPQRHGGRLVFHGGEVARDGTFTFEMPLESLHWKGEPDDIYPFALIEYPVSAFRIAKAVYEPSSLGPDDRIIADFALIGVGRWRLRPYSPQVLGYLTRERGEYTESNDLVWEKPLVFRLKEIADEPDWCAYRLAVRRTYEAFDYYEDEIPGEFDLNARRLVMDG